MKRLSETWRSNNLLAAVILFILIKDMTPNREEPAIVVSDLLLGTWLRIWAQVRGIYSR